MMDFVLYCKKCRKFDAECIMCSATNIHCKRNDGGPNASWVRGDMCGTNALGKIPLLKYNSLYGEELDNLTIDFIMQWMSRDGKK